MVLCSRTRILAYNFVWQFTTCSRQFLYRAVLLECIKVYSYPVSSLSYDDCSIRVYRSFITIFHKCLILLLIFALNFLIMLALCLMLSITHYAQNDAGIKAGHTRNSYIFASTIQSFFSL